MVVRSCGHCFNMRTLQSGRVVNDSKPSKKLTIDSECPEKWLFVDLETGDIWKHCVEEDRWKHVTRKELNELKKLKTRI